jgi:hypothetical protein
MAVLLYRIVRTAFRSGDMELSNHHRDTLEKIFEHPSSGNVEWRQVRSLLEAVGDVLDEPNGKLRVTLARDGGRDPAPREGRRRSTSGRSKTDAQRRLRAVASTHADGRGE